MIVMRTLRSRIVSALASACVVAGCGGSPAKSPALPPVHLPHGEEILTRAGAEWFVKIEPEKLFGDPIRGAELEKLFDDAAFTALEGRHGVDLRKAHALFIAKYSAAVLFELEQAIDPALLDKAFSRRVSVESTKSMREGDAAARITVKSGPGNGVQETLAIVGVEGALLERGGDRYLRAALRGVLGRPAMPALVSAPLSDLRLALDADRSPACIFAPGPFSAEQRGIGHLLLLSPAIGACATFVGEDIVLRSVLLGDFRADEPRVRSLLEARFSELEKSDLGRLMIEKHAPLEIGIDEKRISLTLSAPRKAFLEGLHRATGASLREIVTR